MFRIVCIVPVFVCLQRTVLNNSFLNVSSSVHGHFHHWKDWGCIVFRCSNVQAVWLYTNKDSMIGWLAEHATPFNSMIKSCLNEFVLYIWSKQIDTFGQVKQFDKKEMNAADLPYHWSPLLQTVHLPGVKEVPELPQHPKGREKHKRKDNSSHKKYSEHL